MILSYEEARKLAEKGYAFLEERGRDFVDIDIDALDMGDCFICIFGQLFETYMWGCEELGLSLNQASKMGFDLPAGVYESSENWDNLTDAWKALLRERRR